MAPKVVSPEHNPTTIHDATGFIIAHPKSLHLIPMTIAAKAQKTTTDHHTILRAYTKPGP
jgi:hypothetical protein